jgi:amino acid adenylation domain-containing protein
VGTPVAGRTREELEGLIGFFVNTLVLRTELDDGETFRALVRSVRERALEAYAHQDVAFEQVVERLQPLRDLSSTPLFQVLFQLQAAPGSGAPDLPAGALHVSPVETGFAVAKFDLSLGFAEGPEGLTGVLEYDADLFDPATITSVASRLGALLERAAAAPEASLAELTRVTETERHRVLVEWNDTRRGYACGERLEELVSRQAERTPGAVAVVRRGRSYTYRELMDRSLRIASALRRRGVTPDARVAVCLERDLDLVAALLAVLQSGGAYVPLDAAYPVERLASTLADSGACLVLTQRSLAPRVPEGPFEVLVLEDLAAELSEGAADAPPRTGSDRDLAYLIYTSGSTGRPKGVAIEHRSAVTLLRWAGDVYGRDALAVVLASTSICFDLSVYELFAPLATGGTVVIARDLLELPELAEGSGVTLVNTVPSALTELLRLEALPSSVRTVNLAGEPLPLRLVQAAYARPHVEKVYNLYGPSEDTTYSTSMLVPRQDRRAPSIGRPVADTCAYVLDARLEPVPAGAVGELYLGGAGLARGYLGRPALTAERFVPDAFGAEQGARLYRTGDLARHRTDGTLEFLGRQDNQLKLRGFRIELGEVEAVLSDHAGVREAVVVAREDGAGDMRLVAYVVPGAEAPDSGALKAWVARRLPAHFVPLGLRDASIPAAHAQRKDRPQGAACAGPAGARGTAAVGGAAHAGRDAGGHDLERGAGSRQDRPPRRLLRPRRPFAARHAGDLARAHSARGGPAAAHAVHLADGGGVRARHRGGARDRRLCGRSAARGAAASRTCAPLPRPAAAVVPRPARAGERGLQHAAGPAPARRARRPRSGACPRRLTARHEALRTRFVADEQGHLSGDRGREDTRPSPPRLLRGREVARRRPRNSIE